MKRNEILGEQKKGVKAVKYNKKPKDHSAEYGKAKEKLAPVKPMEENLEQEALYRSRGSSSAYDRDKRSSETGFERRHDHRDLEHELGHETNNYAVAIDGRTWKVFASRNHAEAVARSLQNKGKKATVHETGAEPTAETAGDPVGTVSSATPDGKVSIKTSTGDEIQTSKDALMPGANGTLQMKPDAAGDTLKPGAKVVSTEDMSIPTTDSNSPISGDEENVNLRRLRELAGQPAGEMSDTPTPESADNELLQKMLSIAGLR